MFATADPAFGIIDKQGRSELLQGPGQLDFSTRTQPKLRISNDGGTVEIDTINPNRKFRFTATARRLDVDRANEPLTPPVTIASGLDVTGWKDEYHLAVNGKQIALDKYERSGAWRYSQIDVRFILGTEWSLRRVDSEANELWNKVAAAITWAVNSLRMRA